MFVRCLVVALAVAAAAANAVKHKKSYVQRAFEEYQLVPDVVDVGPKSLLAAKIFGVGTANLGNTRELSQIKNSEPVVSYPADRKSLYTIVYVDADWNAGSNDNCEQYLLLLMVNVPGNKVTEGQVIAEYFIPQLEKCSSYHRMAGLVFKQHEKIHEKDWSAVDDRESFSVRELVERYHLGQPIAGNFVRVRDGEGCADAGLY